MLLHLLHIALHTVDACIDKLHSMVLFTLTSHSDRVCFRVQHPLVRPVSVNMNCRFLRKNQPQVLERLGQEEALHLVDVAAAVSGCYIVDGGVSTAYSAGHLDAIEGRP